MKEAEDFHDDGDRRFERHLGIVLDGLAARPDAWVVRACGQARAAAGPDVKIPGIRRRNS
ncbi:hypothetical protein ACWDT6_02665 [Nocardia grenadensis]|uniref:hypothetical protein n=1 Tax=Nocardia grenadensis TaxID=931537 RepID=UPI003D73EE6A